METPEYHEVDPANGTEAIPADAPLEVLLVKLDAKLSEESLMLLRVIDARLATLQAGVDELRQFKADIERAGEMLQDNPILSNLLSTLA